MMSAIVNLSNLRDMTDGDKELESTLFHEFFSSSEILIGQLKLSLESNNNDMWRKSAHALKGASYNLGAQILGDFCKQAQEDHIAPQNRKIELLNTISDAYGQVKDFLEKELS
jgi:HPt (histidine-containing phosphotransfer) domain-containing protein